ncbi:hypothetical protein MTO96_017889 [Rhipicephalus appendiculatus]
MVRDVLKHLPVTYAEHENWPEAFFGGLLSSSIIYTGFDKLKLSGPVVPYCRNGTRLVQVELATTGEDQIIASASWKTCNGLNGTFGTYTGARVTVTFEVVKPGYPFHVVNGAVLTHHSGPKPVFIDKVSLFLDGAGDVMATVIAIAGKLFPQFAKEFWIDVLTSKVSNILAIVSIT